MKVNEYRIFMGDGYRLVNMDFDGKTYAYSKIVGSEREIFEVYFNRDGRPEKGHYTSRAYRLHNDEKVPKAHHEALEFLKAEHEKFDWESYEVAEALTGGY